MFRHSMVLVLLASGCNAERDVSPVLVLENDKIELGDVLVDTRRKISIRMKNHGTGAVKFEKVLSSCTCSGAGVSTNMIEPAASGDLWIGVEPKSPGPGGATVTVVSNCSINPQKQVHINWNCVAPVEIVSPIIQMGGVSPGEVMTCDVVVQCRQELLSSVESCRLKTVETLDPRCAFFGELPLTLSNEAPTSVGKLIITAADVAGDALTQAVLKVDGAVETELKVQVSWKVVSPIETIPQRLSLGEASCGSLDVQSGSFVIRSNSSELIVEDVSVSDDWLKATSESVSPTASRFMVMRIVELPAGIHCGSVDVKVKSPVSQTVTVPVSVIISPGTEESP